MIVLNYSGALASVNVRAFLRVIREGESNQDDDGPRSAYRAMYHPTERRFWLGPLAGPHPRHAQPLPDGSGRVSTAFGAYQFTWTTVQDLLGRYDGLENDIRPWAQDCWCIGLIHLEDALDDIISGRFDTALAKCRGRWASLPGSPLQDGGSKVAYARARAVWERYGGNVPTTVATSTRDRATPPAPIEDRSTQARAEDVARINAAERPDETPPPAAPAGGAVDDQEVPAMSPLPFILPLLQSLFEAFSPVLRAKATKALDKQTGDAAVSGQVADRVLEIVKGAAGAALPPGALPTAVAAASDPLVAVATVKQSPVLLAQVEAQVTDYLDQIAPLLDRLAKEDERTWAAEESSRSAAAERARGERDMATPLLYISASLVGLLVLFACGMAAWQVFKDGAPSTEVWAQIAGLIGFGTGVWVTIVSYRFGTSRSSSAKDVVIAELSTRRPAP